jgi:outer membrane protein assembly factor BamB
VTASDRTFSRVHGLDAADGDPRWSEPLLDVEGYLPTYETGAFVQGEDVVAGWSYTTRRPLFMITMGTVRVDPVTGEAVRRSGGSVLEGGGALAAVRGDTLVHAAPGIPDSSVGNRTDIAVEDTTDPSATWSATVSGGGEPLVTLGADGTVFQTGSGSLTTTPGPDVPSGSGVRAFRAGGPDGCVVTFTAGGVRSSVDLTCPAWVTPVAGWPSAPVLVPGAGELVVATDAGTVHGLDQATGAIRWTAAIGANGTTPALDPGAGVLHVPLAGGGTAALRLADCAAGTCAAAWTTAGAGGEVRTQPAVANGVVYTGSDDGSLTAAAAAGCGAAPTVPCAPLWSGETGSPITGAPAISTGRLVAGTADGRVVAYAPTA